MSTDTTPSAEQPWTIGRLLTWTTEYLAKCGSLSPRLDAEVLLAHARKCERIMLYTAFQDVADEATRMTFRELVRQRAEGVPVAYLVGQKEFYSLPFYVSPDVLIPRPETEFLVMAMLDFAKQLTAAGATSLEIADVGCGSGAVAVTLAKQLPQARVTASDISAAAVDVARRNAERHQVADRVEFLVSDLFDAYPPERTFDLIASNPPYISPGEMEQLPRDVSEYEPHLALAGGGEDGLATTLRLLEQAESRIRPGGAIALETSPMLAERLQERLTSQAGLAPAEVTQDLAGLARIVAARKRPE
ncbi:MAG: peptide chain release factor N(5)-glutamine methyltransferase [Planctomycetales bacterium]|nr:peptide chain release factor N(5)-glutamine methyltransferase [Planctomycetales bacterium]